MPARDRAEKLPGRRALIAVALAALTGVAGCVAPLRPHPPQAPGTASATPVTPEPSPESRALARYYARVQDRLLAQGLLRTDGGGPDTPYTTRTLVENFEQVALYDEYALRGGQFVPGPVPSHLRRWDVPVRMQLIFGQSVTSAQRAKDTRTVRQYVARLARLSRHGIRLVASGGNFLVLVMNMDEARAFAPKLAQLVPGIGAPTINEIANLPRSTYCSAYALSGKGATGPYTSAVAMIRAEHPPLMRLSCFHEELSQALGLANDSPHARPSIFNDDEEFALLTTQDELMLRMLYDRRLKVGMTLAQADPIVRVIAAELMGGQS